VLACAQKISGLTCLTVGKLKMNQCVPNKNADLLKKFSLMGTELGIMLRVSVTSATIRMAKRTIHKNA